MKNEVTSANYVHFSRAAEWLFELGIAGTTAPVRICWHYRQSSQLPQMMYRYLDAGFIDLDGRLVECLQSYGDTLMTEHDPAQQAKLDQALADLEQQVAQLGHQVRGGRYLLNQHGA